VVEIKELEDSIHATRRGGVFLSSMASSTASASLGGFSTTTPIPFPAHYFSLENTKPE
jgi:hypothetical protein